MKLSFMIVFVADFSFDEGVEGNDLNFFRTLVEEKPYSKNGKTEIKQKKARGQYSTVKWATKMIVKG